MPDLRSNIISLGQATESGYNIRMREDYLTLYDRDGNLLVKANRYKNCLYKVIMEVENTRCLQLMKFCDSAKWHARLRHVDIETMKTMTNKEIVTGIPKCMLKRKLMLHAC